MNDYTLPLQRAFRIVVGVITLGLAPAVLVDPAVPGEAKAFAILISVVMVVDGIEAAFPPKRRAR